MSLTTVILADYLHRREGARGLKIQALGPHHVVRHQVLVKWHFQMRTWFSGRITTLGAVLSTSPGFSFSLNYSFNFAHVSASRRCTWTCNYFVVDSSSGKVGFEQRTWSSLESVHCSSPLIPRLYHFSHPNWHCHASLLQKRDALAQET